MAEPIWKDYDVVLGAGDAYFYRIRVGSPSGSIVYSGKAYRRPGDSSVNVRINDICADYISQTLPTLSEDEFSSITKPLTFYVQSSTNGNSWGLVDTITFQNDWSYDYRYDATTMGMAFPVNGKVDRRMWLTYSAITPGSKTMRVDGASQTISLAVDPSFDGTSFKRSAESCGAGTAVIDMNDYPNAKTIQIGNATYNVVDGRNRFALYYVNAYGGMDFLLIEGNAVERDAVTRQTRGKEYDNALIANRGEQNYLNEVSKEWTLHTGYMTDVQSHRMHHLFNSTEVYLYDIVEGEMMPVIITIDSHDYKTYKNQGCKMFNYEIGVKVSQDRARR